jgi:two-component system cell cycle response regulator
MAKKSRPARGAAAPKPLSPSGRSAGTVLVIDDSPSSLKRTAGLLGGAGYEVITAVNGLDGVRRVFQDSPDLVVCDVVMPELNGYQVCRLLKNDATVSHIPIILLTSLGEERDRFWGTQAGAESYVVKKNADVELVPVAADVLASTRIAAHYSGGIFYVSDAELDDSAIKSRVSFLLDKLLFEQTLENEGRRLGHHIHNRDRFIGEFLGLVRRLVAYERAGLLIKDRLAADFYLDADGPISTAARKRLLERAVRDSGNMRLFDHHRVLYVRGSETSPGEAPPADPAGPPEASVACCRIASENEYLGSLVLERGAGSPFPEDALAVLHLLRRTVTTSVKLMLLYEENRWLSVVDPLTQLYNRRYFMEHFESQYRQFMRYKTSLALLFIDIDNFKLVNDTYGHHVADMVLTQVAEILRASARTVDLVARVGGEEFVVMLPQTPVDGGKVLAERLRDKVERFPFGNEGDPIRVTISIGVAAFTAEMRDAQALLDRADRAMYEAKLAGKNRVVVKAPG